MTESDMTELYHDLRSIQDKLAESRFYLEIAEQRLARFLEKPRAELIEILFKKENP